MTGESSKNRADTTGNGVHPGGEDGEAQIYPRSAHPVSRKLIDEDALKVMYRLIRHGYKAYLVGGGVRDLLLGKRPKDFDIATDATPKKIKSVFRNCRIIGRRFKLAHIYFRNNRIFEVATFRASQEPGDEESVSDDLLESDNTYGSEKTDARRRDLTINGLFYDLSTFSIIDYVGGMQDLQDGLIRIIGDPTTRFEEDPVRMLRAIRHAARASFHIEKECWGAIIKHHELITSCPAMRVFEEFKKDLLSGSLFEVLKLLHQAKLLHHLLPDLDQFQERVFHSRSYAAHVLSSIDRDALEEKNPSLTAALTVLPLLSISHEGNFEQDLDYHHKEDIHQFVHEFYRNLLVPRRIKENIANSITLFFKFIQAGPEKLEKMNLERRRSIVEVSQVFEWMLFNEKYETSKILLQKAATRRKQQTESSGGSKRKAGRPSSKGRRGRFPKKKKFF